MCTGQWVINEWWMMSRTRRVTLSKTTKHERIEFVSRYNVSELLLSHIHCFDVVQMEDDDLLFCSGFSWNTTSTIFSITTKHRTSHTFLSNIMDFVMTLWCEHVRLARGWRPERKGKCFRVPRNAGERSHVKALKPGIQGRAKDPRRVHTATIQIPTEAI